MSMPCVIRRKYSPLRTVKEHARLSPPTAKPRRVTQAVASLYQFNAMRDEICVKRSNLKLTLRS